MRYYPVFLDVAGKPAVVIGGGSIAAQKVEGLLQAGADVTVISPKLSPELQRLVTAGRLAHVARNYQNGDLQGFALAFVATDDRSVNAEVTAEAREYRVLVNAVDDPPNCDFIMPSIVRKGDIIVAISTSGGSPAMARKLREQMEEFFSEEDAELLALASEVRKELREKGAQVADCQRCGRTPNDLWNAALDANVKRLLGEGKRKEAKELLVRRLLAPAGGS